VAEAVPRRGAGRDRCIAVSIAGPPAWGFFPKEPQPPCVWMHGQGTDLWRARYAVAPTGGVAAIARSGARRPRCA